MTGLEKLQKEILTLKSQINDLKTALESSENNNEKLEKLVKYYEDQLKINRKKMFGKSSEKHQIPDQLSFFNEAESVKAENPICPEPKEEEIVVKRKKAKKRGENYDNLPVETIEYKLEDTACPKCGSSLHVLKKEIRKELKIIPAQVKVIEHIKYVYACRNCEKTGIDGTILSAKSPNALIPKSFVSASVLAHIMNEKYTKAMPLDRQEKDFKRNGVNLPRQTLSKWIIQGANLLKPLYANLKKNLLENEVLHADETTLEVLREPGRNYDMKSYMWVYKTIDSAEKSVVLYEYTQGRSGKFAKEFLGNFSGYLVADGYAGYHCLEPQVTLCGCYAHLRRKFYDSFSILSDDKKSESYENSALEFIAKLFEIEEDIKDKKADEKLKIRHEKSLKIVDEFYDFIDEISSKTLPKSLLGKAICYAQNQKKYLLSFLKDGRIALSNNSAERSIKPFVIGRKNWLFSNTPGGAKSSAIIYSIIQTAIENHLKPLDYLQFLFEKIQIGIALDSEDILPWSDKIPISIRLSK